MNQYPHVPLTYNRYVVSHPIGEIFHDSGLPSPASSALSLVSQEMSNLRQNHYTIRTDIEEQKMENLDEPCDALLSRFWREQGCDAKSDEQNYDESFDVQTGEEASGILNARLSTDDIPSARLSLEAVLMENRIRLPVQLSSRPFNINSGLGDNGRTAEGIESPLRSSESPVTPSPIQDVKANRTTFSELLRERCMRGFANDDETRLDIKGLIATIHQPKSSAKSLPESHTFWRRYGYLTNHDQDDLFTSPTLPIVSSPLGNELRFENNRKRKAYKKKVRLRYSRYKLKKHRSIAVRTLSCSDSSQGESRKREAKSRTISRSPSGLSESSNILDPVQALVEERVDALNVFNLRMTEEVRGLKSQVQKLKQKLVEKIGWDLLIITTAIEHDFLLPAHHTTLYRLLDISLNSEHQSHECLGGMSTLGRTMGGDEVLKQAVRRTCVGDLDDTYALTQREPHKLYPLRTVYTDLLEKQCRRYFLSVAELSEDEKVSFIAMSCSQRLEYYEKWINRESGLPRDQQSPKGDEFAKADPLTEALGVLRNLSTMQYTDQPLDNFLPSWDLKKFQKPSMLRTVRKNNKKADYFGIAFPECFRTVSQLDLSLEFSDSEAPLGLQDKFNHVPSSNPPYNKVRRILSNLFLVTVLESWIGHEVDGENYFAWRFERYATLAGGQLLPNPIGMTTWSEFLKLDGREFEHIEYRDVGRDEGPEMLSDTSFELEEISQRLEFKMPRPQRLVFGQPQPHGPPKDLFNDLSKNFASRGRFKLPMEYCQRQDVVCISQGAPNEGHPQHSDMTNDWHSVPIDGLQNLVNGALSPPSSMDDYPIRPGTMSTLQQVSSHGLGMVIKRSCRPGSLCSLQISPRYTSPKILARRRIFRKSQEEIRLRSSCESLFEENDGIRDRSTKVMSNSGPSIQASDLSIFAFAMNGVELPFSEQLAEAMRVELSVPIRLHYGDDPAPAKKKVRDNGISLPSVIRLQVPPISSTRLEDQQLFSQGLWNKASVVPLDELYTNLRVPSKIPSAFHLITPGKKNSSIHVKEVDISIDDKRVVSIVPAITLTKFRSNSSSTMSDLKLPPPELCISELASALDRADIPSIGPSGYALLKNSRLAFNVHSLPDQVSKIDIQEVRHTSPIIDDSASNKCVCTKSLVNDDWACDFSSIKYRTDTPPKVRKVDFGEVTYAPSVHDSVSTRSVHAKSLAHEDRGDEKEIEKLELMDEKRGLRVFGNKLKLKAKSAFGSTGRSSRRLRKVSREYISGSWGRASSGSLRRKASEDKIMVLG